LEQDLLKDAHATVGLLCSALRRDLPSLDRCLQPFRRVALARLRARKEDARSAASQKRGGDAQLDASTATTNYGSATSLNVAAKGSTGQASRSIVNLTLARIRISA